MKKCFERIARLKRRETYFKQSAEFGVPMKKCFGRIARLKRRETYFKQSAEFGLPMKKCGRAEGDGEIRAKGVEIAKGAVKRALQKGHCKKGTVKRAL